MTKLEQLIKELCPNGVKYLTLEKTCSLITDGSHFSPTGAEDGYYMPSVKDMRESGFDFSECKKISQEDYDILVRNGCKPLVGDLLVAKDGSMLKYAFSVKEEIDIVVLSSIAIFRPRTEIIIADYLGYYLTSEKIKQRVIRDHSSKGGVPRIVLKNFKRIEIPVPPLEVQAEIVKILDEYSTSVTALQQELEKELTARKKQYEYYRDLLLDFGVHGGGDK